MAVGWICEEMSELPLEKVLNVKYGMGEGEGSLYKLFEQRKIKYCFGVSGGWNGFSAGSYINENHFCERVGRG